MSLENYQISNQEMIDHIGSEVETTDCKYSRKTMKIKGMKFITHLLKHLI